MGILRKIIVLNKGVKDGVGKEKELENKCNRSRGNGKEVEEGTRKERGRGEESK